LDSQGEAILALDGEALAQYTIQQVERQFTEPPYEHSLDVHFGDSIRLVGATVTQTADEIQVDLVWQSLTEIDIDYVVFVQLLTEDGVYLRGRDVMPNERPFSGWVAGEYVVDSHLLHTNDLEYKGNCTLIVG